MDLTLQRQFEIKPPKWLLILLRAIQQTAYRVFYPLGDHEGMGDSDGPLHIKITACLYIVYFVVHQLTVGYANDSPANFILCFVVATVLMFGMGWMHSVGQVRIGNNYIMFSVFDAIGSIIGPIVKLAGFETLWEITYSVMLASFLVGFIRNQRS